MNHDAFDAWARWAVTQPDRSPEPLPVDLEAHRLRLVWGWMLFAGLFLLCAQGWLA
jgi:hypothetical protein